MIVAKNGDCWCNIFIKIDDKNYKYEENPQ